MLLRKRLPYFIISIIAWSLVSSCAKKEKDTYIQPKLEAILAAQLQKNLPITFIYYQGSTEPDISSGSVPTPVYAFTVGSKISDTKVKLITGTATSFTVSPALPTGLSLDSTTGTISGTPTVPASPTGYTVTASNGTKSGTSALAFYITGGGVSCGAVSTTTLESYYCAGTSTAAGATSSPGATLWDNYISTTATLDGTLNNFSTSASESSGWNGTSSSTNFTRLMFDGTDDYVTFGTGFNSLTSTTLQFWAKPSAPSSSRKVILGNASSATGIQFAQNSNSKIDLTIGKSYEQQVLALNPIAYLPLNQPKTTQTDVVSSSLTLTVGASTAVNSPYIREGSGPLTNTDRNGSFVPDGTYPATAETITLGSTYSVAFWVYPIADNKIALSIGPAANGAYILFASAPNIYHSTPGTNFCSAAASLNLNAWNHVVVTRDGGQTVKFYLDGTAYTSGNGCTAAQSAGTVTLGGYSDGTYTYTGSSRLAHLAFFTTELTQAQVTALYASRTGPVCQSLSSITDSKWWNLAGSFDSATGLFSLFVNGSLECAVTTSGATYTGSTQEMLMGKNADGNVWGGGISSAAIYSSAISTATVAANMSDTQTKFGMSKTPVVADSAPGSWLPESASIIGNWSMNGTSGAIANSATHTAISGPNLTATNDGGMSYATGVVSNGITVDGNDYLSGTLDGTGLNELTLSLWVKPSNVGAVQGLFQWTNAPNSANAYVYLVHSNGRITARINNTWVSFGGFLSTSHWSHIALTLNTSDVWTAYMNGQAIGTYQDGAAQADQNTATTVYFGTSAFNTLTGSIDESVLWNKALTAAQIETVFRNQKRNNQIEP